MKKTLLCLFAIICLFFSMDKVFAKESFDVQKTPDTIQLLADKTDVDVQCDAIFGNPKDPNYFGYYLQLILNVIKYVGILLCIILTITDFAKALFAEEKDKYKELTKKALVRFVYAAMLFFLPSIVNGLLSFVGAYGTCGIE